MQDKKQVDIIKNINGMLTTVLGLVKKQKKSKDIYSERGYYPLIWRWIKSGYEPEYIHWTVEKIYKSYMRVSKKYNVGYIKTALRGGVKTFEAWGHNYKIYTRDELLNAGYSIDMLPMYMLNSKERKERNDVFLLDVTDGDVNEFKDFIEGAVFE